MAQRHGVQRFHHDDCPVVYAALNLTQDGNPLTYKEAKAGPNAASWETAECEELERLIESDAAETPRIITPKPKRKLHPTEAPLTG